MSVNSWRSNHEVPVTAWRVQIATEDDCRSKAARKEESLEQAEASWNGAAPAIKRLRAQIILWIIKRREKGLTNDEFLFA
jgi:hypothetical protein